MQAAESASRLSVEQDGTLLLDGARISPPESRSAVQTKRLVKATEHLAFFRDLRMELKAACPSIHYAICAAVTGESFASGAILFRGAQSLHSPLLVLSGRVTLLTSKTGFASASVEECLAPEVEAGSILSFSSVTWLEPRTVAAAACGPVQVLRLPARMFAERLKLSHLRMLSRRTAMLASLPLFDGCGAQVLRSLAHACVSVQHKQGEILAREGSVCEGLLVLLKGSARVSIKVPLEERCDVLICGDAPDATDETDMKDDAHANEDEHQDLLTMPSQRDDDGSAIEKTIAFISAPEVIGVIDLLDALLVCGRRAPYTVPDCLNLRPTTPVVEVRRLGLQTPERPTSVASVALCKDPEGDLSVTAFHGASVYAASATESVLIPTAAIVRHVGAAALSNLANAAFDRKIVRRALRSELQAQVAKERQERKLRSWSEMEVDETPPILLGQRATIIAAAALERLPARPQTAPHRSVPVSMTPSKSPASQRNEAALQMLDRATPIRTHFGLRRPTCHASTCSPHRPLGSLERRVSHSVSALPRVASTPGLLLGRKPILLPTRSSSPAHASPFRAKDQTFLRANNSQVHSMMGTDTYDRERVASGALARLSEASLDLARQPPNGEEATAKARSHEVASYKELARSLNDFEFDF